MFNPDIQILVVDDMLTMRKIVSKACQNLGFKNITTAEDGNQAWNTLCSAEKPIQLIISDWNMPNCTGIELLKKVRADDRYKDLPFLLVTAEAETSQILEAIKAKVSNYVVKPFTPDMFQKKMEEVYNKHTGAK